MSDAVLLGDEGVALGAIHAGLSAGYAYPGTPSTEILEFIGRYAVRHGTPRAVWAANEKTAFEQALGAAFAGERTLVAMKHVGLNVAADPFMNSALVEPHGGLVVAVADDPGMHSSQNEQDSRVFADFARVPCFEPADPQEAYEMTREAFEVSERFRVPVMVRLVTRLAHARSVVRLGAPREQNPPVKAGDTHNWVLLPANARHQWRKLLARQNEFRKYSNQSRWNAILHEDPRATWAVVTTGVARNYYVENAEELEERPLHLHLGFFPPPLGLLRQVASRVNRMLVLEDGYPWLERQLRGLVPHGFEVHGRETGHVPPDGELTPDTVRSALGLPVRTPTLHADMPVPGRPPQLCQGCPHADAFSAITKALEGFDAPVVTSDIGCYTLGVLPPYNAGETCVCMGASIGMAKGASDAGLHPVVATIGDSTFLHSGVTGLIDCVSSNADVTIAILDNGTVGMTGGQPTILPSSRLEQLVLGIGVDPAHVHVLSAHPKHLAHNTEVLRHEIDYRGLSVVILARECLETARTRKAEEKAKREPVSAS